MGLDTGATGGAPSVRTSFQGGGQRERTRERIAGDLLTGLVGGVGHGPLLTSVETLTEVSCVSSNLDIRNYRIIKIASCKNEIYINW